MKHRQSVKRGTETMLTLTQLFRNRVHEKDTYYHAVSSIYDFPLVWLLLYYSDLRVIKFALPLDILCSTATNMTWWLLPVYVTFSIIMLSIWSVMFLWSVSVVIWLGSQNYHNCRETLYRRTFHETKHTATNRIVQQQWHTKWKAYRESDVYWQVSLCHILLISELS